MTDRDMELKALLVRAAEVEGARQAARERFDQQTVYECERELAKIWRRYGVLERAA